MREIDAKVAECLGYTVTNYDGIYNVWEGATEGFSGVNRGHLPHFSTTWEGMGVLIEEAARKQELYLLVHPTPDGYIAEVWLGFRELYGSYGDMIADAEHTSAPMAAALAFLKAKGVDVTPFVGVEAE